MLRIEEVSFWKWTSSRRTRETEQRTRHIKKTVKRQKESSKWKKERKRDIEIIDASTIDSLEKDRKNGRGLTSEVFDVLRKERLALKQLEIDIYEKEGKSSNSDDENENENVNSAERFKRFLQEYEIINSRDHANIVRADGFCFGDSTQSMSILLEFCASNLKSGHSAGVIHRDLKLENILLDDDNHAKVSDFGLSGFIEQESGGWSRTQMVGTASYMAPELVQGRKDYDEKVDV